MLTYDLILIFRGIGLSIVKRSTQLGSFLIAILVGLVASSPALIAAPRDTITSIVPASNAVRSPAANGLIAFADDRDGTNQIYTVEPDGAGLHKLTNDTKNDFAPVWSPDGRKIAFFQSNSEPHHDGMYSHPPEAEPPISIIVMNADGSGQHIVAPKASHSFRNLSWSPDSTELAVECSQNGSSEGNGQICVINIDGSVMRRVAPADVLATWPDWSPDGRWIAFVGEPDSDQDVGIYVVSPDSGTWHRVLKNAHDPAPISWSADGQMLAFIQGGSARGASPAMVSVIDVNGSRLHNLDMGGLITDRVAWSPDGNQLLVVSGGITVVNADGSDRRTLVSNDHISWAAWSPDSQAVMFVHGISSDPYSEHPGLFSRIQLDVIGLDGSSPQTLVDEPTPEPSGLLQWPPSWQPVAATGATSVHANPIHNEGPSD